METAESILLLQQLKDQQRKARNSMLSFQKRKGYMQKLANYKVMYSCLALYICGSLIFVGTEYTQMSLFKVIGLGGLIVLVFFRFMFLCHILLDMQINKLKGDISILCAQINVHKDRLETYLLSTPGDDTG